MIHALQGDADAATRTAVAEMEQPISNEWLWRLLAGVYAMLDRPADALRALQNAERLGFINYPNLTGDATLRDCVGDDPGYLELLAKVEPRWQAVVDWESRSVA
jgi:hypothetical protein